MRSIDRLDDFEPFEFRVAECERLALASVYGRRGIVTSKPRFAAVSYIFLMRAQVNW
jgi:hypothetical protein